MAQRYNERRVVVVASTIDWLANARARLFNESKQSYIMLVLMHACDYDEDDGDYDNDNDDEDCGGCGGCGDGDGGGGGGHDACCDVTRKQDACGHERQLDTIIHTTNCTVYIIHACKHRCVPTGIVRHIFATNSQKRVTTHCAAV